MDYILELYRFFLDFFSASWWQKFIETEFYRFLLDFFSSPKWQGFIGTMKTVAFYLTVILGFFLAAALIRSWKLLGIGSWRIKIGSPEPSVNRDEALVRWEKIKRRLEAKDGSSFKLAIIEADKIFDDILIRIGYAGTTMGDRLKQITAAQVPNINDVWLAHRLRNELVHNPDERISHDDAERVVKIFERALKDMEVL